MREKLNALYELQQIDTNLAKAEKTKANLDDGSSKRHQVEAVRQKFQQADKLYHDATAEMQDKELNLKTVETKQKNYRDRMYGGTVSNPKELESMEKEIEMLGRQKEKLEERVLELMDIIEARKAAVAKVRESLDGYEAELAVLTERVRQEAAVLTTRIQELTAAREKLLPAIDPGLLKRYESMRMRLGGMAISKVEAGNCTACHTQIIVGLMADLKAGLVLQTCENCSRILYLEK